MIWLAWQETFYAVYGPMIEPLAYVFIGVVSVLVIVQIVAEVT